MADSPQNLGDSDKQTTVNPPITMKVDAPVEDSKQENDDIEQNSCKLNSGEEFKICSPSSRIVNPLPNPFASVPQSKTRGILKPPQLNVSNNSSSKPATAAFVLNPSRLNPVGNSATSDNGKDEKNNQINGETPKFVPLLLTDGNSQPPATTTAAVSTTTTTSSTTFVFGQNLQDRVVTDESNADDAKPSTSLNTNGTSDMLFSNAIKSEGKPDASLSNKETKSLSESAREYEESRANKRKYEEVEVITGEEGETNILNITCKLFAFDKASGSWQERGRGTLRLNDLDVDDHTQSRLVFRTTGSLRVVLNTKIWAEMTVELASEKSVRFTALDANGVIRVFLAMASIEDTKHLYSHIESRVKKEISTQKHKKFSSHPATAEDSGGD